MEDYELRSSGGKPPPKRRRNIEQLTKFYVDLVAEAISSSPAKTMMVGEICGYLKARYGCGKSEVTLKNTIRHTLSYYSIFKKVRKEEYNRPALWTVCQEENTGASTSDSDPGPSGLSQSGSSSGHKTQESVTKFEEILERLPKPTATISRVTSASFPSLLSDDPENLMEPSAARYSIPAYLDQMR